MPHQHTFIRPFKGGIKGVGRKFFRGEATEKNDRKIAKNPEK